MDPVNRPAPRRQQAPPCLSPLLLLVATVLTPVPRADAATIHVPGDALTIQQAIYLAGPDDVVLVAPGTYYENLYFSENRPSITVVSEAGPSVTIIDGQGRDHVAHFVPNTSRFVLEGFTIRGGYAPWLGGGIACFGANVVLRDNIVTANQQIEYGGGGGGIYIDPQCHPETTIEWNLIVDNVGSNGCGIWTGTEVLVRNNTIAGNESPHAYSGGGGILCTGGWIEHNVIVLNHADDGGGIYCNGPSTIRCNDIWSNTDDQLHGSCDQVYNFAADPLFCLPEMGDYTLDGASPCLPGASPAACGLVGAFDQGCGPIAVEPTTWGQVKATYR
ncbi:MAG: right-handed parallel beta-helix repeat-containing protein [Candidatus Eiseniibacteriota bacterium]|jgi:hypothetical protein